MAYDLEFEKPLAELEKKLTALQRRGEKLKPEERKQITALEAELRQKTAEVYRNLSSWQCVQVARHKDRPYMLDYIKHIGPIFMARHLDTLPRGQIPIDLGSLLPQLRLQRSDLLALLWLQLLAPALQGGQLLLKLGKRFLKLQVIRHNISPQQSVCDALNPASCIHPQQPRERRAQQATR